MRFYAISAALLGYKTAEAVECFVCTSSFEATLLGSDAGVNCWNTAATAPTSGTQTATVTGCETCTAQIDLVDGFPKAISRGCETTTQTPLTKDYNAITCSATLNAYSNYFVSDTVNSLEQTSKCTMDCTSDKCNSQFAVTDLTVCGQIDDYTQKWCDFTSGTWYCLNGFYPNGVSTDSNPPGSTIPCQVSTTVVTDTFTPIQCVQCNSMTDSTCFEAATQSNCNDETYQSCYSTSTVTYDRHTGTILKEAVVKGCSTAAPAAFGTIVPDQCFWSDARTTRSTSGASDLFYTEKDTLTATYDQGVELVCSQRCDPSNANCNSIVPNGQISTAEETIYCAVYNSDSVANDVKQDYDFSASRIACPAGTTGCYSKVSYLLRDDNKFLMRGYAAEQQNNVERVRITRQERGCLSVSAPEVTENKCTDSTDSFGGTKIQAGVTMHTCEEHCVGNICNDAMWPNRVRCLRTDAGAISSDFGVQYEDIVVKPCPTPADDTCYISEYNFLTPTSSYYRNQDSTIAYKTAGTDLGFGTTVYRGCTIGADKYYETSCRTQGNRGTGADHAREFFESCNFTCTNHGCNFGTAYSGSFVQLVSPVLMLLAVAFKNML